MAVKRADARKRGAAKHAAAESPPTPGEAQPPAPAAEGSRDPLVGECVDHRHPTLVGRALVRWVDAAGGVVERWVPTLHGVAVRAADRVLLVWPANWAEPLITGVVDGFASRPEPQRAVGASLALRPDETIRVTTDDDACLLEIYRGEYGPVVRLLQPDVEVELAGSLRLSAKSIALQARQGEVSVQASGDVAVRGERIHLN